VIRADVAVVGAGPAGAAAAVELGRTGRSVVRVDKARFPRDKTCGDGLTTNALRELEDLGLDPGAVVSWMTVDEVVLRAPSGRRHAFELPPDGSFCAVARRQDLDAALVDVARKAGAEVHDGNGVTTTEAGADAIQLTLEDGTAVQARYVVAADGMWSPVRKQLGAARSGYLGETHAFRQYFASVGPEASRALLVSFEVDLLPGYLWSFPLPDGRANVGFGIHRGGRHSVRDMADLWPDLLARPHVRAHLGPDARPEGPHRAWPIPARVDDMPATAAGGRALFVGDAVAASDRLTGEGIGQALVTGRLAAQAVVAAGPYAPKAAAKRYERELRRALLADHRMSTFTLGALERPRVLDAGIRAAASSDWTRRHFIRWMFEDEPRAIVATPRRWHRGVFARPGAYGARPVPSA
jgi:geranylgeranyl reductase family protein